MQYYLFFKLLITIYCFILSSINLKNEIKRTQKQKELCEQIGWEFYRRGKKAQLNNLLHFYIFSFGSFKQIRNLLYSKTEKINIAIFDYHARIKSHTGIATVIYFRSPLLNLPNFNLLRKPHLATNTFGNQEVAFLSNSEFSNKYSLLTDDEEAVRKVFSNRLINYFEQKRVLNVEGAKDRLILYCSDGIVEPERIKFFLEEGYRVLELFEETQQ